MNTNIKLDPDVFIGAINQLENTQFSCIAVKMEANSMSGGYCHRSPERLFYEDVFQFERGLDSCGEIYGRVMDDAGKATPNDNWNSHQLQTARIIALQLAALLVEDGFTMEDFPAGEPFC